MLRNMGKSTRKTVKCLLFFFLFFTSVSFALTDDRLQLLQLKANYADINQETHEGAYTQNVELDQGSTHLRADNALTKVNNKNQLTEAIANGNKTEPAHFWTLVDIKKPPLHAYASIIRYFPERHLIELEGNAHVEQGTDSFSAPKISYDTLHKHVISNCNGLGQTVIIFHPENKNE